MELEKSQKSGWEWLPLMLLRMFIQAFVLVKLWAWFIAPVFLTPALTFTQALGIFVLVKLIWAKSPSEKLPPITKEQVKWRTIYSIGISLMALLNGWIIKLFM